MGSTFDLMTPFLLAALGGLYSERAGVLNIALEGQILGGAFAAILVMNLTHNPVLATLAAVLTGVASSALLSFGALRLKSDLFITGLALNLFVPALVGWISQALFGNLGVIRLVDPLELRVPIPLGIEAVDGRSAYFWLALAATVATSVLLFKSSWGLRLRTAGSSAALLESRGLSPSHYQNQALLISGAFAATGGAALALSLGAFVPGMSSGRGWISLVALYLGFRKPALIFLACFLVAVTDQLSNAMQGWWNLPSGFILAIPSLITVVVFVVYSAARTMKKTR